MGHAISLRNISKSYKMYASPADRLKELVHPFGRKYHGEFQALKDVSIDVPRGMSLGIVGRNGSGKSTLLQVIAGILQPTTGSVQVQGRISALLELGAGFNRDFTGRENVFMQGALMGISREEMEGKFESIARFAEIGDFVDKPVRTYSSGMYVRLAFATAINVDPEILIVDEALAVGDEAFQRKCYARIKAFQKQGVTTLFVSHSAAAIIELCGRAMLFEKGELLCDGRPKEVITDYHKLLYSPAAKAEKFVEELKRRQSSADAETERQAHKVEPEKKAFFIDNFTPKSTVYYESLGALIRNPRILTLDGEAVNVLYRGGDFIYAYEVDFTEPCFHVGFGMLIKTITGTEFGGGTTGVGEWLIEQMEAGKTAEVRMKFRCNLMRGTYFMNAGVTGIVNGEARYLHRVIDAVMFKVQAEKEICSNGSIDFSIEPEIDVLDTLSMAKEA